jgi:hypothetical protein
VLGAAQGASADILFTTSTKTFPALPLVLIASMRCPASAANSFGKSAAAAFVSW